MTGDLSSLTVRQQVELLQTRKASPVDLLEAYLERIRRHDEKLHAFVEVYAQEAKLAARAAALALEAGQAVGPLHGIPIVLKDLIEIQGHKTGFGSSVWRDRRSTVTATVVRRLLAHGMIILGKAHMVEFAFGSWGTNDGMGAPWNPWDMSRARTPGGSSSGTAVAVAAGLAPWGIGSDTGGSVRLPSSFCGLTGLKVSAGRISNAGVLPLSRTLDTLGPMALDAHDAALLYEVLAGADPLDERTLGVPPALSRGELSRGVKGLRFARLPDSEREGVSASVLQAYDRSLDTFSDMGAEIVSIDWPFSFAQVGADNGRIMAAEGYTVLSDLIDDHSLPIDEDVRPRIAAGRGTTASEYLRLLWQREERIREVGRKLETVDALLTPTTQCTARLIESLDRNSAASYFTRAANYLDLCAAAIPNGRDAEGLPTSLHVMCKRFDETMALRIAQAYQENTDWHAMRTAL